MKSRISRAGLGRRVPSRCEAKMAILVKETRRIKSGDVKEQNIFNLEATMKSKGLVIIALILLMTVSVVYAKDFEIKKKAGDLNVTIRIDRNPPVAGPNNVEIGIADASGKAITDAKVVLNYSMPAMTGMPAMSYKADAVPAGNVYKARVNYSMSGSWNNELKIKRGDKTISARFTVDAK